MKIINIKRHEIYEHVWKRDKNFRDMFFNYLRRNILTYKMNQMIYEVKRILLNDMKSINIFELNYAIEYKIYNTIKNFYSEEVRVFIYNKTECLQNSVYIKRLIENNLK